METTALSKKRSIESLEDEIATLSATIQAATYRLLCLVGELDRQGGWADPMDNNGFRSCAHWLSWRVGLDLGAARQYVRVARALPTLPQISDAFGRGELSYSKVRALTRIATPENEETLLGWAQTGTASHVEKLVRTFRRANRLQENEHAMEQHDSRRLVTYFDDDGTLVVRGRLTPEQGALFMKALEVSRDELYARKDGSAEPSPANEPTAESDGGQLLADALARMAERALSADAATAPAAAADRFQVVVHVDAEVLTDPEADGRCELEDGPTVSAETARRLACDAAICQMQHSPDGELVPGRKTRVISTALRRALRVRDGTQCAFPGCGCRGRDAHHVVHWAVGGPTVLENIASLCKRHHTLVHEGGYRLEAEPGGGFRFLGRDGRELLPAPPLPTVAGEPADALVAQWIPPDVALTPQCGRPTWMGETFDYGWAVEDLMARAEQGNPRKESQTPKTQCANGHSGVSVA